MVEWWSRLDGGQAWLAVRPRIATQIDASKICLSTLDPFIINYKLGEHKEYNLLKQFCVLPPHAEVQCWELRNLLSKLYF